MRTGALRRLILWQALGRYPAIACQSNVWPQVQVAGLASAASVTAKKGSGKDGSKGGKGKKGVAVDTREKGAKIIEMAFKPSPIQTLERTPEEAAGDKERAKEYSRLKMKQHRMQAASESTRLKLKLAAIEALPAGKLREAAKVPDLAPFPPNRIAASLTPPKLDFIDDRMRESEKTSSIKKVR